ncbi:MAG: TIM44-like domain-containing protein [Bacteroidales bacterium]|nr:TIM44-like domain-containing protein [Bacteroidales bacterium]
MKKFSVFFKKHSKLFTFLFCILFLLLIPVIAEARLGGAGGGGSSSSGSYSGGSHSGDGSDIIDALMKLPFPYNIISIAVLFAFFYLLSIIFPRFSVLNNIPKGIDLVDNKKAIKNLSGFNISGFKKKVSTAFMELQMAWSAKNMGPVRRYISDGMYQSLKVQIDMMNRLNQRNEISKLKIKGVFIADAYKDGSYDVIVVSVFATIYDKFISADYPELSSSSKEKFVEYWKFVRKSGIEERDIFHSKNCPNCGGELPLDGGEISKCPYCGTIINTGAYDWVLSSITQANDYVENERKKINLSEITESLSSYYPDFSIQYIEDIARNGFLQIETAKVLEKPEIMRRFVNDVFFEKTIADFKLAEEYFYNRLFLEQVTLIGGFRHNNQNHLAVYLSVAMQRVFFKDNKLYLFDKSIKQAEKVIILSRDINAKTTKASLYAHQCPNCGGVLSDTIDVNCPYCGSVINSTNFEWIVTNLMSLNQYHSYYNNNKDRVFAAIKPKQVDSLYKLRDYAFNNVLIMIAADGKFTEEEVKFAGSIARKWGYNRKKVQGFIEHAKNYNLSIKMPDDMKSRQKVYKLMQKAAQIDNEVHPKEQEILDYVKREFLN